MTAGKCCEFYLSELTPLPEPTSERYHEDHKLFKDQGWPPFESVTGYRSSRQPAKQGCQHKIKQGPRQGEYCGAPAKYKSIYCVRCSIRPP